MSNPNSIFRPSKPLRRRSESSSTQHFPASADGGFQRPHITRSPSDNSVSIINKNPVQQASHGPIKPSNNIKLPSHPPTAHKLQATPDLTLTAPSGTKRTAHEFALTPNPGQRGEPSPKRPRTQSNLHEPSSWDDSTGPHSPLFFSNSPHLRPTLPPRYSSAEAAIKMLSKAKGEDTGVKTVTLARGSYSGRSPTSARPRPRSHVSHDTMSSIKTDSSSPNYDSEQWNSLSQIGITELLEHDDRPTFAIDLGAPTNEEDGSLRIIYANLALRSYGSLLDIISGKTSDSISNPLFPIPLTQFKEWVIGSPTTNEVLDHTLPSFVQGPISWSRLTLRRRFRIVSSARLSYSSSDSSTQDQSTSMALAGLPVTETADDAGSFYTRKRALSSPYREPQDYFGKGAGADSGSISEEEEADMEKLTSAAEFQRADSDADSVGDTASSGARDLIPLDDNMVNSNDESSAALAQNEMTVISTPEPKKETGFFDWTRLPNVSDLPPHMQFARNIDWGSTALGPIETWSADLRQMCNLIMASPHPAAMYWGDDLVAIYNEAYSYLAGQKHPQLMGQSYREAWAEIWDEVKDVFAGAQTTGQATMKDDDCLFIMRSNLLEETYFSWSIIPMVGGDGSVMGLYNPAFEKTRRKIAERRMLTLREVGERTAAARDVKAFWEEVLAALECNEYDTPFVMLYSLADEDSSDESSIASTSRQGNVKQCTLEGSLGVPKGHAAAPQVIDLRSGTEGFISVFREVSETHRPAVLEVGGKDLSAELMQGFEWRGFGDPCTSVVVCPIHPTTGENSLGFLVMGINPRRPYDDDYSLFLQLLSRQLATSLASVVLFEEEIKRGQRAAKLAALDRIQLSEQLAARTKEALESETKFTRMAEFSPVGMFIADSEGQVTYCNDTWYEISRIPKTDYSTNNWMDYVVDEDKPLVNRLWRDLVEKIKPVSAEWRFQAPSVNQDGSQGPTWVLFSASPERYDEGGLKSVFGSITNISQQKWAEGLQKKKMEEAVELKRQQENFIDTTSHEMRNPLSAILQCADEIVSSLSEARHHTSGQNEISLYNTNIDAAQTIALCAQHQKRIVDDVLTVSKLDSALLVVTPVDAQPVGVVNRALKMFDGELQSADIEMKFVIDHSYKDLSVDWVRFDPSRVLQVLINLTTNAIKFTTSERKRTISVTLSASLTKPSQDDASSVSYITRRPNRAEPTRNLEWGTGDELYIIFSVKDTGRGLSEEEKKSLFLRFKQASPRTHVQYGGSGLGLFISRELTELQGGEIGVASVAGEGSTFAFYVKARRATTPSEQQLQQMLPPVVNRRASDGKSSLRKIGSDDQTSSEQGIKVLVVEDNLVNQRVLKKQLTKEGCIVHVANHGGEALDQLRASSFWHEMCGRKDAIELQVVLLDQEMPVMDGLTCIKHIREMEKAGELTAHVPVIAVTANARQEQISHALSHGMDQVITKPFQIPELMEKMKALVTEYRRVQK